MNIIYIERSRVATLNIIWGVLKWFFYAIWGMVMVDITPMITKESIQALEMFDSFENTAKTFTAIAEFENSKNVKKKVITRKNYGFPVSVLLSK